MCAWRWVVCRRCGAFFISCRQRALQLGQPARQRRHVWRVPALQRLQFLDPALQRAQVPNSLHHRRLAGFRPEAQRPGQRSQGDHLPVRGHVRFIAHSHCFCCTEKRHVPQRPVRCERHGMHKVHLALFSGRHMYGRTQILVVARMLPSHRRPDNILQPDTVSAQHLHPPVPKNRRRLPLLIILRARHARMVEINRHPLIPQRALIGLEYRHRMLSHPKGSLCAFVHPPVQNLDPARQLRATQCAVRDSTARQLRQRFQRGTLSHLPPLKPISPRTSIAPGELCAICGLFNHLRNPRRIRNHRFTRRDQ